MKVIEAALLFRLEERAGDIGLSQRLDPTWVRANVAPGGTHYLRPALWHTLSHRPDVPDHVRCELLITLRTGDRVVSWLDLTPDDFAPLPKVTSREALIARRGPEHGSGFGTQCWVDERAFARLHWSRRLRIR
ncbi:hypothetical protein ACIRPP_04870 [Streptomyces sp. NPDC101219]|uniref:hypothetical protein n=1 Tax=Streptomyces sp. NPDC101219 TaxID=3366131 RepID=UPI003820B359